MPGKVTAHPALVGVSVRAGLTLVATVSCRVASHQGQDMLGARLPQCDVPTAQKSGDKAPCFPLLACDRHRWRESGTFCHSQGTGNNRRCCPLLPLLTAQLCWVLRAAWRLLVACTAYFASGVQRATDCRTTYLWSARAAGQTNASSDTRSAGPAAAG